MSDDVYIHSTYFIVPWWPAILAAVLLIAAGVLALVWRGRDRRD